MKFDQLIRTPYKDNFNYYNLITKINAGYRLFFNQKEKMFEIINFANFNEICLKFRSFDFNLLEFLQKTQIKNAKNIFEEIEINNKNIEKNFVQNNINFSLEKFKDAAKQTSKICFF